MFKRILLTILLLIISAYLVVAITAFNRKPADAQCLGVELIISDSLHADFITISEVKSMLKQQQLTPDGELLSSISTDSLEQVLGKHPLIDQVECYKTPSGNICIEVAQRIPIMRIMSNNGENYYLDNKGMLMPSNTKCNAYLPVATGNINKSFATKELHNFALFLQQDRFWNSQIEQIHVLNNQTVELVPRVGSHTIYLGKLTQVENKLERVKQFYKKALNQVGWNKYSRINVEFGNQIVCTKTNNSK